MIYCLVVVFVLVYIVYTADGEVLFCLSAKGLRHIAALSSPLLVYSSLQPPARCIIDAALSSDSILYSLPFVRPCRLSCSRSSDRDGPSSLKPGVCPRSIWLLVRQVKVVFAMVMDSGVEVSRASGVKAFVVEKG